jgi:lysophospholipase L1-like esterase
MPGLARFERYVALGDSTVEGLDDPDGAGGYRGWANRLAERIADEQGSVRYANLGVRGRTTREILAGQLEPALAMRPDLAVVVGGTNDVLRGRFDARGVAKDIETMQRRLVEAGALVLSFTLPDLTPVMPVARLVRRRVLALAAELRLASARSGARLVDLAAYPVASDPRLWSDDRLHANARGHARIAEALADALCLRGSDRTWQEPLPPVLAPAPGTALVAELRWMRRHWLPWLLRHARGRSSGDGRGPKRPELVPLYPPSVTGLPPLRAER